MITGDKMWDEIGGPILLPNVPRHVITMFSIFMSMVDPPMLSTLSGSIMGVMVNKTNQT